MRLIILSQQPPKIKPERIKADSLQRIINELQASKNAEMITAVNNSWPLLLSIFCIVITTIVVIAYRKNIFSGFGKFNVIKGNLGLAGIELSKTAEVVESVPVDRAGQSPSDPANDRTSQTVKDSEVQDDQPSLYQMYLLLRANKRKEAQEMLDVLQREADSVDKREQNLIFFHKQSYDAGYSESLEEIKKLMETTGISETKVNALRTIGRIYNRNAQYEKAILYAEQAIDAARTSQLIQQISDIIIEMFDPYQGLGRQDDFLKLLFSQLPLEDNDLNRARLYRKIAETYHSQEKSFEESVFLVKATEYLSNDTGLLFQTAYALANLGEQHLAIHYYRSSEKINPKLDYVLNNLGVSYDALQMPAKSYLKLKASFDLGNSLAASNIANRYINGGMFDQAREILDKAKNIPGDVHPNLWKSLDKIDTLRQKEEDKLNEITSQGIKINAFFRKTAEIIQRKENFFFDLSLCNTMKDNIKNITSDGNNLIKFVRGSEDFSITLNLNDRGYGTCHAESKPTYMSIMELTYSGYYTFFQNEIQIVLKPSASSAKQDLHFFRFADVLS